MENVKKAFKNLGWIEWIMLIIMIVIGGYYMVTDTSNPTWYLVTNYLCSIMGLFCVFLCANASWMNWTFAIVNTLLYLVILMYNHVYGTFALELLYYLPTNILGLIFWKKHLDDERDDICKTRKMSWNQRILMILIVLFSSTIYHFILVKIGGATAWLDAFIVAIGIIATFFEMKRFADQYILWLITDIIAVTQWVIIGDGIMITKKVIYTVMAIIGLYNWFKLQKERNKENV